MNVDSLFENPTVNILFVVLVLILLIRLWHIIPIKILDKSLPPDKRLRTNIFIYLIVLSGAIISPERTSFGLGIVAVLIAVGSIVSSVFLLFQKDRGEDIHANQKVATGGLSQIILFFLLSVVFAYVWLILVSNTRIQFLTDSIYYIQIKNYVIQVLTIFVGFIIYSGLGVFLFTPVEDYSEKLLTSLAVKAYRSNNFGKAEKYSRLAIEKGNDDTQILRILGESMARLGLEEEGIEKTEQAVLMDVQAGKLQQDSLIFAKAVAAYKSKDWKNAEKSLDELLTLNPDDAGINLMMCVTQAELKNLFHAVIYAENAMSLLENSPEKKKKLLDKSTVTFLRDIYSWNILRSIPAMHLDTASKYMDRYLELSGKKIEKEYFDDLTNKWNSLHSKSLVSTLREMIKKYPDPYLKSTITRLEKKLGTD